MNWNKTSCRLSCIAMFWSIYGVACFGQAPDVGTSEAKTLFLKAIQETECPYKSGTLSLAYTFEKRSAKDKPWMTITSATGKAWFKGNKTRLELNYTVSDDNRKANWIVDDGSLIAGCIAYRNDRKPGSIEVKIADRNRIDSSFDGLGFPFRPSYFNVASGIFFQKHHLLATEIKVDDDVTQFTVQAKSPDMGKHLIKVSKQNGGRAVSHQVILKKGDTIFSDHQFTWKKDNSGWYVNKMVLQTNQEGNDPASQDSSRHTITIKDRDTSVVLQDHSFILDSFIIPEGTQIFDMRPNANPPIYKYTKPKVVSQ